jgi:RimJ/RimL family protein N-acetyltransferase
VSFEGFSKGDPNQIVMGLFNGQLCAVYVIYQVGPGKFDTHYTSRRKTPKEYVLAGAQACLKWLLDNGAVEVAAYVSEHNKPMAAFVEAIGFEPQGTVEFSGTPIKFIKLAAYQPSKT